MGVGAAYFCYKDLDNYRNTVNEGPRFYPESDRREPFFETRGESITNKVTNSIIKSWVANRRAAEANAPAANAAAEANLNLLENFIGSYFGGQSFEPTDVILSGEQTSVVWSGEVTRVDVEVR